MAFTGSCFSVIFLSIFFFATFELSAPLSSDYGLFLSDTNFQHLLPKQVVATSTAKTTLQCAMLCHAESWCNSFFYHSDTKLCVPQKMVYVSLWANQTIAVTGWRYYRLTSARCPAKNGYIIDRGTATCYRLVTSPYMVWGDARAACNSSQETLVVLEPLDKARFLMDYLNTNIALLDRSALIGASRPEDEWDTSVPASGLNLLWINGQPFDQTATQALWKPSASSINNLYLKNVVVLRNSDQFLFDYGKEEHPRPFICERAYW